MFSGASYGTRTATGPVATSVSAQCARIGQLWPPTLGRVRHGARVRLPALRTFGGALPWSGGLRREPSGGRTRFGLGTPFSSATLMASKTASLSASTASSSLASARTPRMIVCGRPL